MSVPGEGLPPTSSGTGLSLRTVGRTALTLGAGTAAGQILVFGRELIISSRVGASASLDALLIALVVPTMLTGFLSHGTATALVPVYLETATTQGRREARRLAGAVLSWVVGIGVVLAAGTLLASELVVAVTGPGLDDAARNDARSYLPLLVPMGLLAAVSWPPHRHLPGRGPLRANQVRPGAEPGGDDRRRAAGAGHASRSDRSLWA